jgi:hypothetical protein
MKRFHSNKSGFSSYRAKASAVSGEIFLNHPPSASIFCLLISTIETTLAETAVAENLFADAG